MQRVAASEGSPAARAAGVWPRFLAQVLDATLTGIVAASITLLASGSNPNLGIETVAIWVVVALLYFLLTEWAWGTTGGKWLMGLSVVGEDGDEIGFATAAVRTVLRLIDGLGFYALGAAFVWTSDRRQRLGDRLAGTLVVRRREAPRLRSDGSHVIASQVPLKGTSPQPPHMTCWLPNPSENIDELPPPSALPTWEYDRPSEPTTDETTRR